MYPHCPSFLHSKTATKRRISFTAFKVTSSNSIPYFLFLESKVKMADYSIKIMNQSGDMQSYILFQAVPRTQGIPTSQVFTNIYQSAPGIQTGHNSHTIFRVHKDFWAGESSYSRLPKIKFQSRCLKNRFTYFVANETDVLVCGSSPNPLAKDVSVTTSASTPVTLTQGENPGSRVFLTAPGNNPEWVCIRTPLVP